LNFGHTLGHAIESYFLENKNKTTLLHGEAIAVYDLESYISMIKKLITETEYLEIKTTINIFDDIVFAENDIDPILELLIHDKKMNTVLFNLP
jgi:3-dehydroquinate synthase